MIEVTNLTKLYPNQRGVRDISFSVARGELLGLLGPNGAGKSTIMRIITGYMYPGQGTVKVGGCDIFEDPIGVKRQIGYLPENPPLYPEMSVTGYLRYAAYLKGVKRQDINKEIARVTELTGLETVKRQLVGSLSKGFKQRVGLAQALLNSPPVLILDEPTVGLDPKQIIEIRNLIRSLAKEHTVILSSHILPEVNMICGRVVILDKGRLVAVDTPDGLARQLAKGQKVVIEARGKQAEVEKLLKKIKDIQEWSPLGTHKTGDEKDSCSFQIQGREQDDIREMLFRTFAEANIPLLEMRSVNLSLEEIFLQLTTTEDAAGETAKAVASKKPEKAGEDNE